MAAARYVQYNTISTSCSRGLKCCCAAGMYICVWPTHMACPQLFSACCPEALYAWLDPLTIGPAACLPACCLRVCVIAPCHSPLPLLLLSVTNMVCKVDLKAVGRIAVYMKVEVWWLKREMQR